MVGYYDGDGGRTRIDRRRAITRQLGLDPSLLRQRARRLRLRLERELRAFLSAECD